MNCRTGDRSESRPGIYPSAITVVRVSRSRSRRLATSPANGIHVTMSYQGRLYSAVTSHTKVTATAALSASAWTASPS